MKLALRLALVVLVLGLTWFAFSHDRTAPKVDAVSPGSNSPTTASAIPRVDVEPPADVPSVESAREAVAAPPKQVAAPETAPRATTLLRVHVIAFETRKPIAGKSVGAHRSDATRWSSNDSKTSHAALGERAMTNDDGRAEIEVEPGHELTLDVADPSHPQIVVPPLADGEQRNVEVELRTEDDLTLFGRLVDNETSQAVGDGVVWFDATGPGMVLREGRATPSTPPETHSASDEIHADSDGRFQLKGRSWEEKFVDAKANGYARVVFAMQMGHDSPDRALEVRMSRAAILEVSVLDGERPAKDARVDLTTESYRLQKDEGMLHFYSGSDPRWSARTDAGGRADVEDLMPNVPLQLSVTPAGRASRKEADAISLQPGERRKIEIRLGSGAAIVGRIEDTTGTPVAGCTIWRLASDDEGFESLLKSYSKPAAVARADEQGRFRFDDVAVGAWLIGPKPEAGRSADANDRQAFAPTGQVVKVEAGSSVVDVILRVERGLYLTGTVLDPQGAPAGGAFLLARSESQSIFLDSRSDATGHFTVGPMPAGAYLLQAGGMGGPHASSEDLHVAAGDGELVLHLRPGGTIRGRVIDAAGKARECNLAVANEARGAGAMRTSTRDGTIQFKGLLVGTYSISATTSDGSCGRRSGIVVEAGATTDGIEVVLEPGAKLSVRYDGQNRYGMFEVLLGGVAFTGDNVERGRASVTVVPAGEIEVRWYDKYPNVARSERLTLAAGQEREVVWDGK